MYVGTSSLVCNPKIDLIWFSITSLWNKRTTCPGKTLQIFKTLVSFYVYILMSLIITDSSTFRSNFPSQGVLEVKWLSDDLQVPEGRKKVRRYFFFDLQSEYWFDLVLHFLYVKWKLFRSLRHWFLFILHIYVINHYWFIHL